MGEKPRFGDIVENGWASVDNPTRTGFFVRQGCRTGRMNAGPYVEVTDGHGKFWELPMDKGHRVTFRPAADALEAHEHSDGRDLLTEIDRALTNEAASAAHAAQAERDKSRDEHLPPIREGQ